jgi:hypothetical protein
MPRPVHKQVQARRKKEGAAAKKNSAKVTGTKKWQNWRGVTVACHR